MVLSHIFKQKKYILSYSKKLDNVIDDLKICDNNFNIEEISKKNSIDINEFEYKEFDNNIKIMAEKQFYMLDQYLAK